MPGPFHQIISMALAALAGMGWIVLLGLSLWRLKSWPSTWYDDQRHPIRHPILTTPATSLMFLATLLTLHLGPTSLAQGLWVIALVMLMLVTGVMLQQIWNKFRNHSASNPSSPLTGITPLLFLPVSGLLIAPVAGMALNFEILSLALCSIGVFLLVLLGLLVIIRWRRLGLWSDRFLTSTFYAVSPLSCLGLSLIFSAAPTSISWFVWGLNTVLLLSTLTVLPRLKAQPFTMSHWLIGAAWADMATLTLSTLSTTASIAVLALASLVNVGLLLATWRGLRGGTLLKAEPIASIQSVN